MKQVFQQRQGIVKPENDREYHHHGRPLGLLSLRHGGLIIRQCPPRVPWLRWKQPLRENHGRKKVSTNNA